MSQHTPGRFMLHAAPLLVDLKKPLVVAA